MLYSFDSGRYVTNIPHEHNFNIWRGRLSPSQIEAIFTALRDKIEGDEIVTAGWIPGSDWTDTPFQSIYDVACRQDEELAAKCFGLFLWQLLLEDDDVWGFGRYEKEGVPIRSMTYFRVESPPRR